ncbi:hypothetical protein ABTK11_21860, partial [Acinetobacter baumannii]
RGLHLHPVAGAHPAGTGPAVAAGHDLGVCAAGDALTAGLAAERHETSPVQRGFPTTRAMNARGMDNRMSTCRTRMNPSVAC